jgi:hypothetical protein
VVFCHNAADRTGASWHRQLAPFIALEFAVSDAAKGIASGLDLLDQQRLAAHDATPLTHGLDLFHTTHAAQGVLKRAWQAAEAAWAQAEAIDARVASSKRAGLDARGVTQTAAAAWRRATRALEEVEGQEAAWRQARAAFELFDSEGQLNDRRRAEAEIAAALPGLGGGAWKTVRNFLGDRRSLAFLDRMHERLAVAEPGEECRIALAWRWWGRHRRSSVPADPRLALITRVAWDRPLGGAEAESYDRVAAVLSGTVRSSSVVECLNGVLRKQQSNHKRMTQEMLDLKRLYWNTHRLDAGKRKGGSPYQHLGLTLRTFDFWELLQSDPAQLTQQLTSQKDVV